MINQPDYVELGLFCADVCTALNEGLDKRGRTDLSSSVREAIEKLTA